MNKTTAEPYDDIDFTNAEKDRVTAPEPGKTKISIPLDNRVLDNFRGLVGQSGGGNYQPMIIDAMAEYIQQRSKLYVSYFEFLQWGRWRSRGVWQGF